MTLQICRYVLAFLWIYQGLVPKLLGPHPDELAMNLALGLSQSQAVWLAYIGGGLEVLLGVIVFIFYKRFWVYQLTIIVMFGLSIFAVIFAPQFLVSAFNVVTGNVAMMALAGIGLLQLRLK